MRSINIISVDAKDLYGANISGKDYSAKYLNGKSNIKKYINTFDDSLDLRKLREVYKRKYRRNDFYFFDDNVKVGNVKRAYTNHVVNVTFNYSHKEYNKCSSSIFVKDGYSIRDLQLEDSICIVDGEVLAIEVGKPNVKNQLENIDCRYFRFDEEDGFYIQCRSIKTLLNVRALREYLYEHGFTLDGIKYVRYKRSSGSARVGKCLFINEELFTRMHKYDMCGLKIKRGQDIDLAAFEAAMSLSLSSIIDTIKIAPENILLIEDYDSIFEDEVVGVSMQEGRLYATPEKRKVSNSIWDGQSLLDKSLFGKKYANRGMLLLRNRFFKTCGFNTDIQKFFTDNNITSISQLNGVTLATDVSQIKMITTPNSIKYLKFGSLSRWLRNIEHDFGVVKYDKPTHFFGGRMVQTHYQLLNTLQMDYGDVEKFLQPSLEYISKIKSDPAVLRHHIKYPNPNPMDMEYRSKNDVVFGLMGLNEEFTYTKYYQDFKKDLVKSLIKGIRKGHVLVEGTYATMFGNGLEMLKASVGMFDGASEIGVGNIYSPRFRDGERILGTRSPHINSGNVYLVGNKHLPEFDKYFYLTNEIVCVNAIDENIQQRLNGADYDSDTVLITNNQLLIDKAEKNYDKFLVPTSFVEAEKTHRKYTTSHQTDLDVKTSVNLIGEVVNLSQELNSVLWHSPEINKEELYYDICKLAVLSGIEIDRAKKEFQVDSRFEIEQLKSKYKTQDDDGRYIKPLFFKMITTDNGYPVNPNIKYTHFKTPMDFVQKIASTYIRNNRKASQIKLMPLHSVIKTIGENRMYSSHYAQRDDIISCLRQYSSEIRKIFLYWRYPEERLDMFRNIKELREEYMSNVKFGKRTAYLLLRAMDDKCFSDITKPLFMLLFCFKNSALFEIFLDNKTGIEDLVEDSTGDVELLGNRFRRQAKPIFQGVQNLQFSD